jgi:hypothetical protein
MTHTTTPTKIGEHVDKSPAVGEARMACNRFPYLRPPTGTGCFVVGREIDQRAEHLQIGDERVHLGHSPDRRRNRRAWPSDSAPRGPTNPHWDWPGHQVGFRVLDHLVRVGHADTPVGDQVIRDVGSIFSSVVAQEPYCGMIDSGTTDCGWIRCSTCHSFE